MRFCAPSRSGFTPYRPMPMPACQHTMSVTVSGPFTIGPDLVALVHVFPPAGLGAPRPLSRVLRVDLVDLLVGVRLDDDRVVAACARAPSPRSVRTISRYWPESSVPVSSRNTCAVHSWIARPANSLGLSSAATSALRRNVRRNGNERRPPLACARGIERVHAAQRIALHQLGVLGRDRGDLVLADQRVAADEHRRRDRRTPSASSAPYSGSHHNGLSSPYATATLRKVSTVGSV